MSYFDCLREAMDALAGDERTLFVGQGVKYYAHALTRTLQYEDGTPIVPPDRVIEMPVVEDFQAGFCTGLALEGFIPICIYPRFDFLLLAANQIVTHLDKIPLQSEYRPKVILRTAVGATKPLHSGWQHTSDHTQAFCSMLHTINVVPLKHASDIIPAYRKALAAEHSSLMVEYQDLYS